MSMKRARYETYLKQVLQKCTEDECSVHDTAENGENGSLRVRADAVGVEDGV